MEPLSIKKKQKLDELIQRLTEIRDFARTVEGQYQEDIAKTHPYYRNSARNLLHYLAIRTYNLNKIQDQLSSLGLSSLEHSEGYTLVNLNNVLCLLNLICGYENIKGLNGFSMDYWLSRMRLEQHANELFGPANSEGNTRIMVTMPTEAADDKKLIKKLLNAGMKCARINCSHDNKEVWAKMIKNIRKISKKKGLNCKIYMDLAGSKLRTGPIREVVISQENRQKKNSKSTKDKRKNGILLFKGDKLLIFKDLVEGKEAKRNRKGQVTKPAFISTTVPAIFDAVKIGESIFFDDGKIGGEITGKEENHFEVTITSVRDKGRWLMESKGINLPDSDLVLPSLTKHDLNNIPFILANADMIGYSFARKAEDVAALQEALREHGREDMGIIIKIETWDAFYNLPEILLMAMRSPKVGVMIARGDLAVEVGWQRMSELQEEILWLCEAAHIPTIWATQVLENLAKKGLATRSEITDAAMAGRAECAMLNKGPYIDKALLTLREIMTRMQAHQRKKMDTLRPLGVAKDFVERHANKGKKQKELTVEI